MEPSSFLYRRANQHVGTSRARNRALDQEQAPLFIDRTDPEILHRDRRVTHVTRHLLAFEYATRALILAYGTRCAMRPRVTVGSILGPKVVSLHDTCEALADTPSPHIDDIAGLIVRNPDFSANRVTGQIAVVDPDFE
jgi:hypothetical protein